MQSIRSAHIGYRFFKRIFDVGFSILATALCLIPGFVIGLAIHLDSPGNVIFTQKRLGKDGRAFTILKFRTMVDDAENVDKYLTQEQKVKWMRERKVDDDPRVTLVGKFLRRLSLDELPQFINVLKGEMSVVGPRPVVADELQWYGEDAVNLLSVKPGITGWWQIEARSAAKYQDQTRQALDMHYVENIGVGIDLHILVNTLPAILKKPGK